MEWTLVIVGVFAIFIPALIMPGPDFVAVVRSSLTHGVTGGIATTLGVTLGLGFYATLSLVGFSAVLLEYQWLAWCIRVCGGLYLIYLGAGLLLRKPAAVDLRSGDEREHGNPVVFGLLVTLTNPKAIVIFTSVFAAAVTESMPDGVMAAMIVMVMTSAFVWYSLVSLFIGSAPVIAKFRQAQEWVDRAAGACFSMIGTKLLFDARSSVAT